MKMTMTLTTMMVHRPNRRLNRISIRRPVRFGSISSLDSISSIAASAWASTGASAAGAMSVAVLVAVLACAPFTTFAPTTLAQAFQHDEIQEFQPPKLSFTSLTFSSHSVGDVGAVKEVGSVPWKVFQGVLNDDDENHGKEDSSPNGSNESTESAASVKLRAGPLLSMFLDQPEGRNDGNNDGRNGKQNDGRDVRSIHSIRHAEHVVLTPREQRAYLVEHGGECIKPIKLLKDANGRDAAARFDALSKSSSASLAMELWKYCALFVEGGIYVDAETAPLVALGDVLNWAAREAGDKGSEKEYNKNYAVLADSWEAGVATSLLDGPPSGASTSGPSKIATGALLAISTSHHGVPRGMVELLMTADIETLEEDALLLPKALMAFIRKNESSERDGNDGNWGFFSQRCQGIEIGSSNRLLRHCPAEKGYCCEIVDPSRGFVFLLSRHSLLPNQFLPHHSALPQPFNRQSSSANVANAVKADDAKDAGSAGETSDANNAQNVKNALDAFITAELPFLSTIHVDSSVTIATPFTLGNDETTPNAYKVLEKMAALPNKQQCLNCLRDKNGATCGNHKPTHSHHLDNSENSPILDHASHSCQQHCAAFCEKICEVEVKEKPIKKALVVRGPRFRKDPERLIPRIIHQTWFEPVTPEKYPNMSRLIESWKRSGWEYRFYDDATAAEFLSVHFPMEVREAYDTIIPGAFKADLFRYCVLLITGGIYADMDVMLEANLDAAVPPDIGFMVPVDAPGSKPDHRMCLWNGFIAAAPAHPYLARVIEHVVNNIRNRFTVVDYDKMLCPAPELSVPHAFSTLFTAGPCILGFTLNQVMGRELQATFAEGDLERPSGGKPDNVPGRTIILRQNKWDMGAHRFTWVENNLVVAATDMPDYDDRQNLEGTSDEKTHYSKTQTRSEIYGLEKAYVDRNIAHETILFRTEQDHVDAGSASALYL